MKLLEPPVRQAAEDESVPVPSEWDGNTPTSGKVAGLVMFAALSMSPVFATSTVSAAPAATVDVQAVRSGWSGNGGYLAPSHRSSPGHADAVKSLRSRSGLTWDELAKAFGVSRRSVHNWAAGSRMTSKHAARLSELTAFVANHDKGNADATREALLTPDSQGRSPFGEVLSLARSAGYGKPPGASAAVRLTSESVSSPSGEHVSNEPGTLRDRP